MSPPGTLRRRIPVAHAATLLFALAATPASAVADDAVAPRFSMTRHALAADPPRSEGGRFAMSATLAPKAVPKDVSWDARFQLRAQVAPKTLATVTCGSDLFRDSFED
jgi:hypothetical protein